MFMNFFKKPPLSVSEADAIKLRNEIVELCRVCNSVTKPFQEAYKKFWYKCPKCDFLQAEVSQRMLSQLNKGEGFRAGTGVGGGGYREFWISKLLIEELNLSKVLLYGTGNTPTFQRLYEEGGDVWGCDISKNLVAKRKNTYKDKFFTTRDFPRIKFDAIVAVEVFEHFLSPIKTLALLFEHLSEDGVIAGTTDFYEDGDISTHVYIEPNLHISYWSRKSLETVATTFGRRLKLFKLECPGSIIPDEKFGLLWPRKRVFFIYPEKHHDYFMSLEERYPVLPINKP